MWNDALQATGPTMAGHMGGVTDMALAPDGTLAVADRAGTIHFWDPSTGSPAQEALQADDNTIWGVAWSTDGTLLAAASDDQVVLVWEIDDRRLVAELTPHPAGATDVGFLGRGRTVATTSRDGSVQLFDVTLARRIGTSATGHSATAWRLAVFPDRTRFATSSEDGSVQLWDALHLGRACERADGAFDAEQQRRYLGEGEGALGCN